MKEQPTEVIDNNEGVNVTPSNTTDTLSIKQQRKEAADKLGISYKDSLNMSLSDLQDPDYKVKKVKKEWLYADKKISEMQKEEPEEEVTIITPPVEAAPVVETVTTQPAEETNVIQLPTPQESAGKGQEKKRRISAKKLATAALIAISAFGTIGAADKSDENTKVSGNESADSANAQSNQSTKDIFDLIKYNPQGFGEKDYNRSEQHVRDRMSTEGAFDGEKRNVAELDAHVLAKVENNPSLMAAVLEVRESGNKDASFSLADVNTDTRKFSVHGDHGELSAKGDKATDTLERSWNRGNQGKLLSKSEVSELMSKYMFINHGTNEGKFKNSIDDTTYSAGEFDYRPDLGDEIYKKTLGNGEIVYFKVNEKDAARDCLNVQTLRLKGELTPPQGGTPTPGTPGTPGEDLTLDGDIDGGHKWPEGEKTPTPDDKKGPAHGSDDGTRQYGNNGEIHENDGPEDQQTPSAGNNTNVDTGTSENAAGNGSGSSDTAPGAAPSSPDRDPDSAGQTPGAGNSNTNNNDPGQPK